MILKYYGLPYMGSKNLIAEWVVDHLPPARRLYDLFCGGGAVSHRAILSVKYKEVYMNDRNPLSLFFRDAMLGNVEGLHRWLTREEYHALGDYDGLSRFGWSFGGNCREYIYGTTIEPFKHALHKARVEHDDSELKEMGCAHHSRTWIVDNKEKVKTNYINWYLRNVMDTDLTFDDFKGKLTAMDEAECERLRTYLCDALKASGLTQAEVGRRLNTNMERHYFGRSQWGFPTEEAYNKMREFLPLPLTYAEVVMGKDNSSLKNLALLRQLSDLDAFYSLESYANTKRIESLGKSLAPVRDRIYNGCASYSDVPIAPDSVIYCDIPYRNTAEYNLGGFDYEAFYAWAERQSGIVVVSEYSMPEDRFECVASIDKRNTYSSTANNSATERLFVPKGMVAEYKRRCGFLF